MRFPILVALLGAAAAQSAEQAGTEPPARAALVERARRQLAEGPGLPLEILAEASARFPGDAELLAMRAAVLEAAGDVAGAAPVLAELARHREAGTEWKPPPAPPVTQPPPTATPGATLFVAATRLRVRAKADDKSDVLGYLPINAKVTVVSAEGPWVQLSAVVVPGAEQMELATGAPRPMGKAEKPRKVKGYARAQFLSASALTVEALLAEAGGFERDQRWHDVVRVLERAATLEFPSPELLNRLCRAALEIGQYGTAAHWRALELFGVREGPAYARVVSRLASGCRGDRARAALFSPDALETAERAPANACLVGVGPCGYCAEKVRLLEGLTGRNRDETVIQFQDALARYSRLAEAFAQFPPPAYLVVEISVPSRPMPKTKLQVVYAPWADCDQAYRPVALGSGLPWPSPGATRTYWVKLPEVGTSLDGVLVPATSPAVALKQARTVRAANCAGQPSTKQLLSTFELGCECPFERDWRPGENYEVCDEPGCD